MQTLSHYFRVTHREMVKMLVVPLATLHTQWIGMKVWRMEFRDAACSSCKVTKWACCKLERKLSLLFSSVGAERMLPSQVVSLVCSHKRFPLSKAVKWCCLFFFLNWALGSIREAPSTSNLFSWAGLADCSHPGGRYQSWELCFYLFTQGGSEAAPAGK